MRWVTNLVAMWGILAVSGWIFFALPARYSDGVFGVAAGSMAIGVAIGGVLVAVSLSLFLRCPDCGKLVFARHVPNADIRPPRCRHDARQLNPITHLGFIAR